MANNYSTKIPQLRVSGGKRENAGVVVAVRRQKLSADSATPSPGPQLPAPTKGVVPLTPNVVAEIKG